MLQNTYTHKKKVLITGITGFVGSHLADMYLQMPEYEVVGIVRRRSNREFIQHFEHSITVVECDLTDSHGIDFVIASHKPDIIHHLAAQSYVPTSWANPEHTLNANLIASLNILEAVRRHVPDCYVHVASSSEIYGNQPEIPIKEEHLPLPASPYAVSKLAMEHLAAQYHRSYGIKAIITRAFNHTGPRRGECFVTSKVAKAFALKQPVKLGNLDASRDWTDVRDICRAYHMALSCEFAVPYNVCSNKTVTIRTLIEIMENVAGYAIPVESTQDNMRPSDVHMLLGDNTKFREKTGWEPRYPFEETCRDLFNYWRHKVDNKSCETHQKTA